MNVLCKFGLLVNISTLLSLLSFPFTFAKGELIGRELGVAEQ